LLRTKRNKIGERPRKTAIGTPISSIIIQTKILELDRTNF